MKSNQSTSNGIKPVRIEDKVNPMLIAGLSKECIFGKDPFNAPAQWQEFGAYVDKIPGQKEYVSYGLCLDIDNGKGIEYVCGVEVSGDIDAAELPGDIELKKLPSFSYAVFEHKGQVSGIRQTCDAIFQEWVPQSGYEPQDADFFFERYGEDFDPKKGANDIEIWIPIGT